MWRRLAGATLLGLALCACRQAKLDDPTLISGGGPVAVLESRYVSSGDAPATLGAGTVTYVVCRLELTNDQAAPLYPAIARFSLSDGSGNRYYGIDSGSTALTGISNDLSAIKPGGKRAFVIAFRAAPTTTGTVRYDY